MPTPLTKFELYTPITGDPQVQQAIDNCVNSLLALGVNLVTFSTLVMKPDSTVETQVARYGLLTNAQAASALNILNTFNAALGTTVLCYSYPITLQP